MIWGGIGLHQRVGPIFFANLGQGRGNGVNAQRYIDQVLRPHIVPFWANHQNFLFQQDNATAHTAIATQQFLQANNINTMPWPALSPDLNPIEHLWVESKRGLNQLQPRPATAAPLCQAIAQVWANIPAARIDRLVLSTYRRCRAVILTQMVAIRVIDFRNAFDRVPKTDQPEVILLRLAHEVLCNFTF